MAEPLRHPGPAREPRLMLAATRVERRPITLAASMPIHDALVRALDGVAGAWVTLARASGDLRFVWPDRATDGLHAAWYSAPRDLSGGTVHRAAVNWGRRDDLPFGHCHGLWGDTMGHLLLEESTLSAAVQAEALVFADACFVSEDDSETGFTLFKPQGGSAAGKGEAALLRLAPHVELSWGLREALDRLGWDAAQLMGLGSLDTAQFADGSVLDCHASEFLVRPGRITRDHLLVDLDIIGIGGTCAGGRLAVPGNRICVTAELVLLRDGA